MEEFLGSDESVKIGGDQEKVPCMHDRLDLTIDQDLIQLPKRVRPKTRPVRGLI